MAKPIVCISGVWVRNPTQKPVASVYQCSDCGTLVDLGQNCPHCS